MKRKTEDNNAVSIEKTKLPTAFQPKPHPPPPISSSPPTPSKERPATFRLFLFHPGTLPLTMFVRDVLFGKQMHVASRKLFGQILQEFASEKFLRYLFMCYYRLFRRW